MVIKGKGIEGLYTTQSAARELGIDQSRVKRMAATRGLGRKLGRAWLFSREDLEAMRSRKRGRPTGDAKARAESTTHG